MTLTDQQLTPAEIRLAQYGQRTSTWSTATYNDGTEKALHEIALGLKTEVDRLRAELATAARRDITSPLAAIVKHGEMSETVRQEVSDLLADATAAADETHVVADDSDDPEHVDDCPGCEPAARSAAV